MQNSKKTSIWIWFMSHACIHQSRIFKYYILTLHLNKIWWRKYWPLRRCVENCIYNFSISTLHITINWCKRRPHTACPVRPHQLRKELGISNNNVPLSGEDRQLLGGPPPPGRTAPRLKGVQREGSTNSVWQQRGSQLPLN